MIGRIRRVRLLLTLLVLWGPVALGQVRPAEEVLAELDAAVLPPYDVNLDAPNTNYRQEFFRRRVEVLMRRAELIGELHRGHPDHPRTADYLPERWETLFHYDTVGGCGALFEETGALVSARPDHPVARYAWYWRAMSAMRHFSEREHRDDGKIIAAVDDFIGLYPEDSRGREMLFEAASFHLADAERSFDVLRRVVREYPGTNVARDAKARLRQVDEVGRPFDLEFEDALTGKKVSIEALRGRVAVIDFWATWCGPCVEALPHLKELHARWKPRGVEFIGVSLDLPKEQGGLDRLKSFVKRHEIDWPQFYQGGGWESEFSSSWGVTSIPCLFVIDQEGRLHAANVRDRLDEVVEALLRGDAERDVQKP